MFFIFLCNIFIFIREEWVMKIMDVLIEVVIKISRSFCSVNMMEGIKSKKGKVIKKLGIEIRMKKF